MEESDEQQTPGNYTNSTLDNTEGCLMNPGHKALIVSVYMSSLVLGQPMAARLLWITLSTKQLDVLNCNLALFHLLQYLFFYVQLFIIFVAPHVQTPFYKFIVSYIQVGGPMQLCFICSERFIAVIHPTYFPLLKTYRCREACVAVVWLVSISLSILFFFSEKVQPVEDMAQYLPISLMGTLSFIMVFTSIKVAKALRNPIGKASIHPMKKRAFITICVTSAAALSCYIPVMVMGQIFICDEDKYKCNLIPVSIFLLSTASLVHPLFYLYAKGEFSCKRETKNLN